MNYKILRNNGFAFKGYRLLPVRYEDRYHIMNWRNAQLKILRQENLLTEEQQDNYFKNVVNKLFEQDRPLQIIFSFLQGDNLIGYGGLVHISWQDKRGEVSFLLDNNRITDLNLYAKEFSIFLSLIKQVAFDDLKFNRICTETFDVRDHHVSILEASGFVLEGRMRKHVFLDGFYRDSLIHGCLNSEYNAEG
jgi:RimJ/RimL family protein N-acetyltransferase